ncbi:MAG: FCD domain-containing protein [Desulfobacterales bacterium]|jgi:DNA-binding FadR family transcriptional regulator|nr:FCD domain-containing protein [Desulfobacterales bacterium]
MFSKVRQVRAFESIIVQVQNAILQGRLAVGQRLPSERELQGLLDVSRNTLRESLRVLEQKGLVEIRKGHRGGIFVKELNSDSMTETLALFVQSQRIRMGEISEFRQDLEGLVTRRAALRADARNTGELRRLLKRAQTLAARGAAQWDAFMQVDKEIHLALAVVGGNPLHRFFLETVHNNLHRYHINAYLPRTAKTIRDTLAELEQIVAAVLAADAERAERLARAHVRRATAAMEKSSAAAAAAPEAKASRSKKSTAGDPHEDRRR